MKQNGFSLLELIVVIGIIVGITGFAVNNYNNFNQTERLRQASKNLKTDIRLAQTRASSGVKPTACTSANATLVGYALSFPNANSYMIQAVCSPAVANLPSTVVALPSNVSFYPTPSTVLFNVLTGTIGSSQTFSLISQSSQLYRLRVCSSGDVNDLGLGTGSYSSC